MSRALHQLGAPQRALGTVALIGGTNGKGSTVAFAEACLRAAGAHTGVFTSPHLSRLTERFRVDGTPVGEAEVVRAAARISAAVDVPLTFFEEVTLLAVCAFADARVDVALLEVGMGGRLDATNAVDASVAAVTGVAMDHEQYLGAELSAIAREKAGIFTRDRIAIIGGSGEPEAVPVLRAAAIAAGIEDVVEVRDPVAPEWELGLIGPHQRWNAACALAVVDAIARVGGPVCDERTRRVGLASARLAGRLEVVGDGPVTLVDGAHNPHGARALAAGLAELAPGRPRVLVCGVSRGKAVDDILAPLVPGAELVIATASANERACPAEEIADAARRLGAAVDTLRPVSAAIDAARRRCPSGGVVVVAGSLFVVGEAREHMCGEHADPVQVQDPVAGVTNLPDVPPERTIR